MLNDKLKLKTYIHMCILFTTHCSVNKKMKKKLYTNFFHFNLKKEKEMNKF